MLRIGLLLPRSTLFPLIGFDLLEGLKASLQLLPDEQSYKLVMENIGFGVNEGEVYSKVERLLLEEQCDVIVAVADTRVDEMLGPLFTGTNKLLLLVNAGANIPDTWKPTPNVITHSLNFCFHAWLTGKMAADEDGGDGAYVTSYYDAGYRQCYAMFNGYQYSQKLPSFTHVTPFLKTEFDLAPLQALLDEHPSVDRLLCLFAGDLATAFYERIHSIKTQKPLSLFVSPMMLEEHTPANTEQLPPTKGYAPWISTLPNENNERFKASIKKAPGYFSLLGWETGQLLTALINRSTGTGSSGTALVSVLLSQAFDSPRGWLKIDPGTQHSFGPAYLLEHTGKKVVSNGDAYAKTEAAWKEFTSVDFPSEGGSGWRNTYLCI